MKLTETIQVLITTEELQVSGSLLLPETMKFEGNGQSNILFYVLNGGFQFVAVKDCEVRDRKNLAFRPNHIGKLYVNTSSIITIQIIHDDAAHKRRKEDIEK